MYKINADLRLRDASPVYPFCPPPRTALSLKKERTVFVENVSRRALLLEMSYLRKLFASARRRRVCRTCRKFQKCGSPKAMSCLLPFLRPFAEGFNNSGGMSSPSIFRSLVTRFRRTSFSDKGRLLVILGVMNERSYT